jgi:hypothetical protein
MNVENMNISIDFCFNVLNLMLRIGIAAFLIKRYVVGSMQKLMMQEKQDLLELNEEHAQRYEACNKISKQMEQDEAAFARLRSKFKTWHEQVAEQELQEKNECLQRQKKVEALTLQKIKYLQNRRLIEKQVPDLLHNVMQTLQKNFQEDKLLGKRYQTKLLDALGKSS